MASSGLFFGVFTSRKEAGSILADRLRDRRLESPIIYAIPRGGLPVAEEIARKLGAKLDIAPSPESTTRESTEFSSVTADQIEEQSISRKNPAKTIVIVDDGMATGLSSVAAIQSLLSDMKITKDQIRIIVAAPLATEKALSKLQSEGFEVCVLEKISEDQDISSFFADNDVTPDKEVESVRQKAKTKTVIRETPMQKAECAGIDLDSTKFEIRPKSDVEAYIAIPKDSLGLVMVIGDGLSAETIEKVEDELRNSHLASFRVQSGHGRGSLKYLREAADKLGTVPETRLLKLGILAFGKSGQLALELASALPDRVHSVGIAFGQVEAASESLPLILSPTLFVTNENDKNLRSLRVAFDELNCHKSILVIEETESSSFNEALKASCDWFVRFLSPLQLGTSVAPAESS